MAFAKKVIQAKITLAEGSFEVGASSLSDGRSVTGGGGNTADLQGLRILAQIHTLGGPEQGSMEMAIFGLPLSTVNQLSNVGANLNKSYRNKIEVYAGDDVIGMNLVFQGEIFTAYFDGRAEPQCCLRISATAVAFDKVKPADPISIKGSADVAGMMSQIAGKLGLVFENNGVSVKLASPYYAGTLFWQAASIAQDAGIEWLVDRGKLAIMPPATGRQGDPVLISKDTGLVTFPMFNEATVICQVLYNPSIQCGGYVKIESSLTAANGSWIVNVLDHFLDSQVPRGKWFSLVSCYTDKETPP